MQEKYGHGDIMHIQNTLWTMYKEFLEDHSVKEYTRKAGELVHRYDGNKEMLPFCQNLVITWTPVINGLAEEFREREKEERRNAGKITAGDPGIGIPV